MTETGRTSPYLPTDSQEAKKIRARRVHHKKQSESQVLTRASINGETSPAAVALKAKLDASIIYHDAMVATLEAQLTALSEAWPDYSNKERYG